VNEKEKIFIILKECCFQLFRLKFWPWYATLIGDLQKKKQAIDEN